MFALLISLSSLAQREGEGPGDDILCDEPSVEIQVSHRFYENDSLPCLVPANIGEGAPPASYLSRYYIIGVTKAAPSATYTLTGPGGVHIENYVPNIGEQIGSSSQYFRVRFSGSGWIDLTVNPTNGLYCELPKTISVPVLCSCQTEPYKVLGIPGELITYNSYNAHTIGNGINYVIGDLEFNGSTGNLNILDKKFKVLGRNAYFGSGQPGGVVYGPKITLTTKDRATNTLTNNSVKIEGTTQTSSYFEGDPCFGMWQGIEVDDSLSSFLSIKVDFTKANISDAFIGINVIPGSRDAVNIVEAKIDACMYGVINARDGIRFINILNINSKDKPLLKPFDYSTTGYSPNRAFDVAASQLKSEFFTTIGLWQASDRIVRPLETSTLLVKNCLVGVRWGNGVNLYVNQSNYILRLRNLDLQNCHLVGLHILARNTLKIESSRIVIKQLYDGNYTTYQANAMLSDFSGNPIIENLNTPSLRFTNHYGIFSQFGHPLDIAESEIIDKTIPKQTNYIDRPIGVFCKNINSLIKSKFIFNDNYGTTPNDQGDISTAEVRAIGVIADGANYFPSYIQSFITDNWFRNLKAAFVFRNTVLSGTNKLTVGCNYFQNVHTGFDFTASSSFANDLGDPTIPCGNRFTWHDQYFGLPNVAPNDCKVLVTMNNVTNQTYYRFPNEVAAFSYGNLLIGNGSSPGNSQSHSRPSCPDAVRDPFGSKVKPIDQPAKPDSLQMGYYNLMGIKVADIGTHEDNLPLGYYLKVDDEGKKIFMK